MRISDWSSDVCSSDLKSHPELPSDDVWAITGTDDGAIWFGTYAGGLYRLASDGRLQGFQHDPKRADSLPGVIVIALAVDTAGTLWLGTTAGLARWNGNAFTRIHTPRISHPETITPPANAEGTRQRAR